jgi:glycine/D-amino acid oxidase-like deaminating enzyme
VGKDASKDVIIIGAGIVGCATAYFLAREDISVTVYDPVGIAAGASGRNNGLIEHPYDPASEAIFEESIGLLADALGEAFSREPVGTLIVARSESEAHEIAADYTRFPQLAPRLLDPDQVHQAEPLLAPGLWGCMLNTGHPVMPLEATTAFAELAREAGAAFVLGQSIEIVCDGPQVIGVRAGSDQRLADVVLITAGAGSSQLLGDLARPDLVRPLWGVIVSVELPRRPNHPLIEGALAAQHGGGEVNIEAPFTLLDSPGWLAVGSTMLEGREPDRELWATRLLERGAEFVPAIAQAQVTGVLVCARPRSFDNRPILGRVPEQDRLWIANGHGGRGMSTGAASARLMADAIRAGTDAAIPAALNARRLAL